MTTFCRSLTRELSGGTKPCKLEETSQPWLGEWPSTMRSFELLSFALSLCSKGPQDSAAWRDCSSPPEAWVWAEKALCGETKQKTPRKYWKVAASSSRGVLLLPSCLYYYFLFVTHSSQFLSKDFSRQWEGSKWISQAVLYFFKAHTVGRDHNWWFGFLD